MKKKKKRIVLHQREVTKEKKRGFYIEKINIKQVTTNKYFTKIKNYINK
jgi:hypothetical protein